MSAPIFGSHVLSESETRFEMAKRLILEARRIVEREKQLMQQNKRAQNQRAGQVTEDSESLLRSLEQSLIKIW